MGFLTQNMSNLCGQKWQNMWWKKQNMQNMMKVPLQKTKIFEIYRKIVQICGLKWQNMGNLFNFWPKYHKIC